MYMYRNLPNILTMLRIAVIPIIVLTFYFDDVIFAHRLGAGLFALACFTDFLDGYLARKFNIQSDFGTMLDPVADKLLVGSVLIMLVKYGRAQEIPSLLIMAREFLVAGLRDFLAQIRVSVPVSNLAKAKTAVQMIALMLLMLGSKGSGFVYMDLIGQICLWVAAILTLVTGYSYCKVCKDIVF
ncbi:MAG: CDP-diacylglycerol--glycerol-3-phosphate 3-phosphatidyltransferase [Pseudomonadota bacterium]